MWPLHHCDHHYLTVKEISSFFSYSSCFASLAKRSLYPFLGIQGLVSFLFMMTLHLGSCIISTMQGNKLRQLSVGSMCSAETESVVHKLRQVSVGSMCIAETESVVHKLRQLSVGSMCSAEAESVVPGTSKEVPSGSWARLVSRGVRSGSLWVFFTKQRPRKDSFWV